MHGDVPDKSRAIEGGIERRRNAKMLDSVLNHRLPF